MLVISFYAGYGADQTVADFYILGLTIVGSILLYPAGNMAYIDALFFASGVATQSGLNTYASMLANPPPDADTWIVLISMTSIHISK